MGETIRVKSPTISDALFLMMALRGMPAKLIDGDDGPEVEVRALIGAEQVQRILTTAANWLADREIDSTTVRLSGNSFHLAPERVELRRRAVERDA